MGGGLNYYEVLRKKAKRKSFSACWGASSPSPFVLPQAAVKNKRFDSPIPRPAEAHKLGKLEKVEKVEKAVFCLLSGALFFKKFSRCRGLAGLLASFFARCLSVSSFRLFEFFLFLFFYRRLPMMWVPALFVHFDWPSARYVLMRRR